MRNIISVVNLKGGVGKTTSAVNFAACWGELGKKVLLVDLDPQGSASMSVGVMNDGNELLDALQNSKPLPVVSTEVPGLDLVPSGIALATSDQLLSRDGENKILSTCLDQTAGDWDFVIIDCPPSLGTLTMNALMACSRVVLPVEASPLGMNGLQKMTMAVESLGSQNKDIRIEAIVPCRAHRRRRIHWDIMDTLNDMFPNKVSPIIRENVSLAEAPGRGKPVILTARISKGADDYRIATLWLDDRISDTQDSMQEAAGIDSDSYSFQSTY